jgi:hypothetical protein
LCDASWSHLKRGDDQKSLFLEELEADPQDPAKVIESPRKKCRRGRLVDPKVGRCPEAMMERTQDLRPSDVVLPRVISRMGSNLSQYCKLANTLGVHGRRHGLTFSF